MSRLFIIVSLLLCLPALGFAQNKLEEAKASLRGLRGGAYIKQALDRGSLLLRQDDYEDGLAMLDLALREAQKTKHAEAIATVSIEHAALLLAEAPEYAEAHEESYKRLKKAYELTTIDDSKWRIFKLLGQLYPLVEAEKLQQQIGQSLEAMKAALPAPSAKPAPPAASSAEPAKPSSAEAARPSAYVRVVPEAELALNDSLQNLLGQKRDLSAIIAQNNQLIEQMSAETAKREALLQYNRRMIDSLSFAAALDSLTIEQTMAAVREKDAALRLQSSQRNFFIALATLVLLGAGFLLWGFVSARGHNRELASKNAVIAAEKERSEQLLLNILPAEVAEELKEKGKVKTQYYAQASILFVDVVNFSHLAKTLSAEALVQAIDTCFRAFDQLTEAEGVEKVKTIGDAYMCIAGVPNPQPDHAQRIVRTARAFLDYMNAWNAERDKASLPRFDVRLGIHSGPVVAGVVGSKKFVYDVWGDSVNIAARMESHAAPNSINISESTYQLVAGDYACAPRGQVAVKNMPDMPMYYLKGLATA